MILKILKAIYITKTPEETIELGKTLAYQLSGGDTVLLFGDLGTGKTHFTKGIASSLGITDKIKSPTFAYVNKYQIGSTRRKEQVHATKGAGPQWNCITTISIA